MKNPLGDPAIDRGDFWVFGYGSLMWRPGFPFAEMRPARLAGYRRDMCFLSVHYRGTVPAPGLVCGLMPGKADEVCKGRAYRIRADNIDAAVAYLDERELITDIYIPRHLFVDLEDRRVLARIYVADTTHDQFVGRWSDAEKAAAIVRGCGSEGRSLDYLARLVDHLDELGIADAHMRDLLDKVRAIR
jgi:cation transport protein ChaC